jgi:diguanylate cyclase (GGDEF)-like protein
MKLREKLALPFAVLVLVAAACGAAGLLVVARIGSSVAIVSEVTSPLLLDSTALISNANKMRSLVHESRNRADPTQNVLAALDTLHGESRAQLEHTRTLAAMVGLEANLDALEASETAYVSTLRSMTDAYRGKRRATLSVRDLSNAAAALLESADEALYAVVAQMESQIIENEEKVKVEAQTGVATTDSIATAFARTVSEPVWVLQNSYRLLRGTSHLHSLVQRLGSVGNLDGVEAADRQVRTILGSAPGLQRKIAGRLRDARYQAVRSQLAQAFEGLQETLVGASGLIAARREELAAEFQIAEGERTLDGIERQYFALLRDAQATMRARNEAAKQETAHATALGRNVILGLILLGAAIAASAAVFLRRRILTPVSTIANHMMLVGGSGELDALQDPSLAGAKDELGDLARAFNGMIGELAGARRQLIERSEAEISRQLERLEAALTNMSQGLCMFDRDQRLIVSNRQYAEAYSIPPEKIHPGMTLRQIVELRVAAGSYYGDASLHVDQRVEANAEPRSSDTVVELKSGRSIQIVRRPMRDGGWVATHEDVTERRRTEAKIAHMARHDALTGLPNRVLFRERLEKAFARLGRGEGFVVHCLDLDHFKAVNDTLGHPIGDALLRVVTRRLLDCVREHDTIVRLGGDEFAIIQMVGDPVNEATALAGRVIEALSQPYEIEEHQVIVGVSIGIAVASTDGNAPDELLRNADLALYRAKGDGRGTYRFFEADMDARMQARRTLELELRKGFASGEFEPYYQPLVRLDTGAITCLEVLLRWHHPQRGLVPADEFIHVLEEIGMIVPVGEWVLKQACKEATRWPEHVRVAVNLSPVQFKSPRLVDAVTTALSETGLAADRLDLEITETVLLEDSEDNLRTLHALKELGAKISMDDFGTGYSSLSYLRSFPFDKIKIDRSFIRDLEDQEDSAAIVRAVASLGQSLGVTTTAEGVETEEQVERLRAEGCTEVQGYFLSPARPAGEVAALLLGMKKKAGIAA